jgi:hypothetical protein
MAKVLYWVFLFYVLNHDYIINKHTIAEHLQQIQEINAANRRYRNVKIRRPK